MGIVDLINVGTAVSAGGLKGFADGAGIDLPQMTDYILPLAGTLTLPIMNKFTGGAGDMIGNTILGGLITGVAYTLGRAAGYMVQNYQ